MAPDDTLPARVQAVAILARMVLSLSGMSDGETSVWWSLPWRRKRDFHLPDVYAFQSVHGVVGLSMAGNGDLIVRPRTDAKVSSYIRCRFYGISTRWDGRQKGWRIPDGEAIDALTRLIVDRQPVIERDRGVRHARHIDRKSDDR